MRSIFFKISFSVCLFVMSLLISSSALAASSYSCTCKNGSSSSVPDCDTCYEVCSNHVDYCNAIMESETVVDTGGGNTQPEKLPNPLGTSDINEMIARVIRFILSLVGSISLLMFVYGGLIWMTSAGSSDKIKKGREIIVWSVIGLAVVFSSYLIVRFVIEGLAT